jgi:hypothetical protein
LQHYNPSRARKTYSEGSHPNYLHIYFSYHFRLEERPRMQVQAETKLRYSEDDEGRRPFGTIEVPRCKGQVTGNILYRLVKQANN